VSCLCQHYGPRWRPRHDTILAGSGCAWAMLFRVVTGLVHRVSANWPSIAPGDRGQGASTSNCVSGTIIRGTLKTPKSQLVTPISTKLQRPDGCD
jgi:hypothetical protein